MHTRIQPDGVFEPVPGLYTQIVGFRDTLRYEIAGTVGYRPDGTLPDTMAEQAEQIMTNLGVSLAAVSLTPAHVVRINIFTTDMDGFLRDAMETVFGWFGDTRPASTLVETPRLANPRHRLEIEAVAVADDA
ncbi:Rid family hydrolase [Streptomyces sp. NPDC026672]|uniref:RidA family protein n=1 Tax=unclassified Streptomyces TaxID=2593676 RepID=UPI0033DF053B